MRSLIRGASLVLLGGVLAGAATAQSAAPKLAYINSQKLLQEAPGRADAEAAFKREVEGYQTEVKRMGDSLRTMISAYETQELTLSPAAKSTRQREIQTKEREYQQRTGALDQKAAQRQEELTRPILQQIQEAIEAERAIDLSAFSSPA